MTDWSDIIRRMSAVADELAVERIRDNPASSALAELRNQPVQGPGANRPMSFKDFRQSSEYDQAPLEQQQALYDTFLQTQLPRFIPKGASEDQRYDVLARFSKENPRPRQPGIFEAFTGGFSRGMESLGVGNAATLGQSPESIAGELRDVAMARPPSASERDARAELAEAARRFNEAKGFANSSYAALQAVGTLLGNGRETVSMLGESLGASIPAFGGAAGGAAVAGPVGMIVGLVAGNAATNVQSNIAQELQEKIAGAGIDMRDQVAVAQVLREHPEWVSDSLVRGTKSGLATAAVESAIDIATFGVSKVARPAVKAGQVALRAGSAVAAQGLAEGAGAIAGEVAVGDAPNYGDALIQGALGTIGGIPDAAIAIGAGAGARPAPPVPVKPDVRVFDDETAPEPAEPASPPLLMLPPPDRKPIIASATGLAGTDADAVERAALAERYAPQPILEDVLTGLVPNGVIDEQAGTATDAAGQPVPGDAAGSTAGGAPGDRPADAATGPEPGRFVSVDDVDGIEAILERIDRAAGNRADSGGADPGVPGDATATATGDAPTDRPADAAGSGFVSIDDTDGLEAALDRIERLATGGIPADRGNPAGRPAIGPAPAGNGGAVGDQTGGVPGSGQQATGPGDRDGGAGDQPSDAPAPVDRPPPRPPQAGPTVVLQNRDRSSASSVAQMSAIAGNPDYLRLSPTRLLSEGAPVVIDEAAVPDAQIGIEDTAVDAQGDKVPIRYAVVEADALLTSHDAQGNPVDGYANGVPGRLRAVAGNGRIAGLQEGYKRGTTTAYVEALARDERATGISAQTIARFKRPVLVRLMRGQDVTSDIGDRTNTSGVSSLSPLEQAANDARRVRLDALEFDDNGAPTPDTIRRFIQGMPQSEQSGLIGKSGEPTRQAVDRLMNAVFHSAYRDDEIVNLFAAATDAEARNVINALAAIAPEANRLEGAGDLDVRPLIVDAAKMAVNARRRGIKLLDMVEQEDITVDHATQEVARIMAEHARSTRAMTDRLRHLIGMAYKASQQGDEDLLSAVPKPSVLRLIEEANQPEAQLFSRVSEPTEPGMTAAAVGQLVSKMLANWASPPGINVVPTLMHSAVPAEVREAAARNAATQAEGFFWDGRVWLVADQLPTANDVLRVTLHESLGHFGLRRTFGQRLDPILRAVIRDHRAAVVRRTRDEGLAIDDERNLMIGAEEHLAYLAQTAPENRLVSRAISAIREVVRQIARAMGADLRLTDADIINSILAPARRNIIEGAGRADADDSISGHGNRQPAMARVFHGTPYRGIEKFDTDMIGAGEGAQAYGWGLYFASKKEVADHYRNVLSKRFGASITKNGKELFEADLAQAYFRIGEIKRDRSGQLYKVLAFNRDDRNRWSVDVQSVGDDGVALRGERVRNHATMPRSEDLERDLSARGYEVSHGQLYEVEIPEDSEMLLWDRPINEQPEKTRSALESLIGSADLASWTGEDAYRRIVKVTGGGQKGASMALARFGVKGIKYLDGASRAARDGSHNYVIFSGDDAKIERSFFSRRPSQVRAPDDPRRTDNFASNQEVMRFAATLRLPPRTLGDVAINERDPIKAARLFGRQAVDRLADTFADAMLPAQRWIERMPVSTEAQRQIIGGLRRAHGIRGSLDRQVDERFGRPMRREIRKLAKQYGMGTDEAMQAVGYWMTANYVPRQNAWLADKDQMAISELQAEQQAAAAAVAQARAQGVTTPALDQQLKAADDALNAATAKAAKRLAEINDPRLGRTEFKIGVSAGMTNAQAAYTKQLIESRIPEAQIRRVAQMGWDLMAWRTQQDLKSGKLTAQMLATWPNHPEYVPTTGDPREEDFEDLVTNVRGGSSLNVPKDKAVGGRTSSVSQDGISAMFDAVGRSINHAAYQDFKRGLSAAYDEAIVDATNELAGSGFSGSQLQIEIRRLAERNLGMAKVNGEPNVGTAKDAIIYRDGGKSAQFLIADPTVTEAIRRENLDRTPTVLQKLFEPGTRIFARLVTTLNPMFAPMNSFRDIWERSELLRAKTIYDQSGNKVNVARAARAALRMMYDPRNVHASIRKAFGRDFTSSQGRDLEEMIELGGLSTWGGYLAKGRQQIADQLRKESMPIIGGKTGDQARALFQLVEGYNQSFDLLSSLAVYRALLAEGVAKEEAAAQTLDLMDFRKTGKAMFPIKAMFVFAQPIVTGGANLIGQLNTRVGRQRFLAYTMLSYGLYSLLKMLDEDNDDEGGSRIDQLGAWTTERSIPIPINESTIFKIPIGFGLPQLAWGTAVHLTRLMSGESTPVEASAELLKTMGKTISPLQPSEISVAEYPVVYAVQTFAPTILKPFAQLATDRNAFGNRITPTFPKQNTLKAEQPKLSTPDIYTDAAVWMQRNMGFDVYPEQIRTVATGLLVGPFRELFFKPFVDNPAREKMGRDTVPPYVSTFIAPFNEWSTIVRGREAYDHLQALAAEKESRTDRGEAIDQWMTPLRRRQLTLYDEWTDAERDVRNEKARATRAFNKGNITEAVRDARYKTATERRDQATARFLYRYRQIIGKPTTRSLRRGGELSE